MQKANLPPEHSNPAQLCGLFLDSKWTLLRSPDSAHSLTALQVSDTKPKRPQWGLLSSGEVHTTTIAAWAHLVILGDADGNLNRWDTTT